MTDQTATTRAAAALLAAEADRDKAFEALTAARKVRDDLKAELQRITGEMSERIVAADLAVRDAVADHRDAEDFVRRLTPRKPRRIVPRPALGQAPDPTATDDTDA